jgi:hypothetical protein
MPAITRSQTLSQTVVTPVPTPVVTPVVTPKMSMQEYLEGVLIQIADRTGKYFDSPFRELREKYAYSEYQELHEQHPTLDIIQVAFTDITIYYDTNTRHSIMDNRLFIAIPENVEGDVDHIYKVNIQPTFIPDLNVEYKWEFVLANYVFSTKPHDKEVHNVSYYEDYYIEETEF